MPSLSVVHAEPSRHRKLAPALSSPPKQRVPSSKPADEPLEAHRHLQDAAPASLDDAVDQVARDQSLADGRIGPPLRAVAEQVVDRDGQVVVGVQQAHRWRDDAVAVDVGVVAPGDVEAVLECDKACHGVGAGAVHADLAVVVQGHEPEGGVDARIHHGDVQAIAFGDRLPVRHGGAAQRVDADAYPGPGDGLHVDHAVQPFDIGPHEIDRAGRRRRQRLGVGLAPYAVPACRQQRVGALLDPAGDVRVRRAAVRRVVLDAAVGRRIVRGRDDEAVGPRPRAAGVVRQDRARDHRGRRVAVVGLQVHDDAIGREHFDGGALGRRRERVGVLAQEKRAGDPGLGAVFGDRLGDGQDMGFVEAAIECAAAVAAGAEGHALGGVAYVGYVLVGRQQRRNVGKGGGRSRLAGKRVDHGLLQRGWWRHSRAWRWMGGGCGWAAAVACPDLRGYVDSPGAGSPAPARPRRIPLRRETRASPTGYGSCGPRP